MTDNTMTKRRTYHGGKPAYLPTPDEIKAECAKIRAGWLPDDLRLQQTTFSVAVDQPDKPEQERPAYEPDIEATDGIEACHDDQKSEDSDAGPLIVVDSVQE